MRSFSFSTIRPIVLIVAIIILSVGIGYRFGQQRVRLQVTPNRGIVINQEPPPQVAVDFGLFWDVWQRLQRYFIDRASLDTQKMVWGAISGMVASLGDPYTTFLPPKENKDFKQDLGGEFEGIGAQLGLKENRIIVIAPLKGTPAEKAGVRPGDLIIEVNDEETIGWTIPQAVSKIRGPRGSTVKLAILHENEQKPVDVTITRDTITVPSVETWVKQASEINEISGLEEFRVLASRPEKIAYLRLSRFGDNSNDEWNKAVRDLVSAQRANGALKGLIFDVRNNPGGYLQGAVFIASEFLQNGTVVSQVNSDGTKENFDVDRKGQLVDIPLVVLINKGSASASEIVAGALRDFKRATLVGEQTFGKGSVQTPFDIAQGAGLHITTGKWLLPNGDSIEKKGITPDIAVSGEDAEATRDAQLAKAIELLLQ